MKKILINFKNLSADEKIAALEKLAKEFGKQSMPYLKVISDKDPSPKIRKHSLMLYKGLQNIKPSELDIEPDSAIAKNMVKPFVKNSGIDKKRPVKKLKEKNLNNRNKSNSDSQKNRVLNFKIPDRLIPLFKLSLKSVAALIILYLLWAPGISFLKTGKNFLVSKSKIVKKNILNKTARDSNNSDSNNSDSNNIDASNEKIEIQKIVKQSTADATALMLSGKTSQAISVAEELLDQYSFKEYPELLDASFILYDCYTLADNESSLNKRQEVIHTILEECPEQKNLSQKLFLKALDCTNNTKDYYTAIVLLEKSISCNPKNYNAIKCLAQLYSLGKNTTKAKKLYSMLDNSGN